MSDYKQEFQELMQGYVTEKYYETMDAVSKNPEHRESIEELNVLFENAVKSLKEARRKTYEFITKMNQYH